MKKIWLVVAGAVLLLGMMLMASCSTANSPVVGNNGQQTGIWVNGEGKVTATPNLAILDVGIQTQETDVAQAQSEAAAAMDQVMTALTNAGIDKKDIQTTNFSIQPVTKWDDKNQEQVTIGYMVTNTVTVKIRKLDQTGSIIDAVAAAGGNLTRINGISFTIDDPTSYNAQARTKAVADAKAKAQQLAENAGVKLGKVTYITESSNIPTPIYRTDVAAAAKGAESTPISTGTLDITVDVQIAYAIGS